MANGQTKISFTKLEFTDGILNAFEPGGNFVAGDEDHFMLCMNWPWRAPDKENFNSLYSIPAGRVLDYDQKVRRSERIGSHPNPSRSTTHNHRIVNKAINIPPGEQLRIWTIPQGDSKIEFSLMFIDITKKKSWLGKILSGIGSAIIGKLTAGISHLILKPIVAATAGHNLTRLVESLSGEGEAKEILGRANLNFPPEMTGNQEIDLKDDQGTTIAKLHITVV